MLLKRVISALFVALTVVGCGPTAPSTKQLASIKIAPDVSLLQVGTVTQFSSVETWVGDGGPPPGPAPAWSMSDDSIAKVDFSGRVTAITPGTTSLTVKRFNQTDSRILLVMP
jgi:hypothetical protein